jgi:hypothetical protein
MFSGALCFFIKGDSLSAGRRLSVTFRVQSYTVRQIAFGHNVTPVRNFPKQQAFGGRWNGGKTEIASFRFRETRVL